MFECRSNWRIYIEECALALRRLTGLTAAVEAYLPMPAPPDDAGLVGAGAGPAQNSPISPFERKYLASGHSLWRVRLDMRAE